MCIRRAPLVTAGAVGLRRALLRGARGSLSEVGRKRVTALWVSSLMSSCETPAMASGLHRLCHTRPGRWGSPPPRLSSGHPLWVSGLFVLSAPSRAMRKVCSICGGSPFLSIKEGKGAEGWFGSRAGGTVAVGDPAGAGSCRGAE